MADGSLPIVVSPKPFGDDAFELTMVEGVTVRRMLAKAIESGLPAEVLPRTEIYIDGLRLPRDEALDYVLRAGQVVNVVVEPLGGGGGGRKDIGQILLQVAIIAISAWIGGPTGPLKAWPLIARVAAAAAVQVIGSMAVNAIFAPDKQTAKANDRYALQSASNQYRPWGPQPIALGEVVAAPDLAAKTFTQGHGEDVWLYGILGVHRGPCEVSEIKIGDTLVSTMGAADWRMVAHLTPGPRTFSLYPNDVDQIDFQEELQATPTSATPWIRAASSDGSRFDLDFFLPGGLHFQKDDGRVLSVTVSVGVRYRPINQAGTATGPWQTGPTWTQTAATKDPIRVTHSINLPHGRYEFELTRSRPADDNTKRRDQVYITAIKSVAFRKPIVDEELSIIEFAVRATAINQGGLAPITMRIKPLCPTWTGGAWGPAVPTSNPAALLRWLLTGPAPAKPLALAQADTRLRTWSNLCDQYGWTSHVYLTETKTQQEAMQILERAGRASVFWDGTQSVASPWVDKPAANQMFTAENLKDYRSELVYSEPVHALRVEFLNFDKSGEPDEVFVYADGYGETADPSKGIQAASLIESMQLDGQATPARAWKDGRWALGQRIHQRRIDTWSVDIEFLQSRYGNRVGLARLKVAGATARVRVRRWNAAQTKVIGLRLSQPVQMAPGQDYAVDMRTPLAVHTAVRVVNAADAAGKVIEVRELTFVAERDASVSPRAGDLIAFGKPEEITDDLEIVAIEPGENLTAVLTGVRYVAPLLMAGETGPIPPLPSRLSGDRQANPPTPTLLGVQQDANGVRVSFDLPTWRGSPISAFSVRWRSKTEAGGLGGWTALPALDASARELRTPPIEEAPSEGAVASRAEIEIVATTVDGRASRPLSVTVVRPLPAKPRASVWSVTAKGAAADGTSQPILIVTGEINDPAVASVLIQWGLAETGPWTEAYSGPPLTKALEIPGLLPGVEYWVAVTMLSATGLPSEHLVIGPRTPGQLVSGDTTHMGGEPVSTILDRLTGVEDISAANAAAVADLDGRVDDTITAAEAAIAAGQAADLAVLKAGEAGGAASAANISAGIATTKAGEAGNSAAASNAARLTAEAARDQSQGAATASVASAANAAAAAGAAEDWAEASEGASVSSAASAGQAQAFRNQASDARDGAVAAQVAAGVSASTAQLTAAKTMPDRVSEASNFYGVTDPGLWVTPEQTTPMAVGSNTSTSEQGVVRQFTTPTAVMTRGWLKIEAGRTYRFTVTTRIITGGANNAVRNGFSLYRGDGQLVGWHYENAARPAPGGWITYTRTVTGDTLLGIAPTGAYVRGWVQSAADASGAAISGVVWQASVLRLEDVTESASAANSAAIATAAKASATASEASASISANLAVSAANARQNLVPNSTGLAGMRDWISDPAHPPVVAEPAATDGARFIWYGPGAGAHTAKAWSVDLDYGPGYLTSLSAEVFSARMISGSIRVYIVFLNAAGGAIDYAVAEAYGSTDAWVSVKREGFVSPAGTAKIRVVMDTYAASWTTPYPVAAWRKIKVENGATATPWNDYANDRAQAAQLSIVGAVAADAQNRLSTVRFDVAGGAGGDPFEVSLRADASGSLAMITATALRFRNILGGAAVDVLKLIGGAAHFAGEVFIGALGQIKIDPSLGAIIWNKDSTRLVIGAGIGAGGQNLLAWFGANTVAPAAMTKANASFFLSSDAPGIGGNNLRTNQIRQATVASQSLAVGANDMMAVDFGYTLTNSNFVLTLDLSHTGSGSYAASGKIMSANLDGSDEVELYSGGHVGQGGPQNRLIDMAIVPSPRNGPRKVFLRLNMTSGPINIVSGKLTVFHLG
ncbi:TipJ family phage tail tip protein [Brevundimonas faecalis]|uniref:Tip attachment protein J HDII-ins2 domain-containing protein n=1 Tax=Brevundimonas faecalis TaxID=947378 RepID=A0ABV2RAS9_9CAUL